jgi:hypothetical protein
MVGSIEFHFVSRSVAAADGRFLKASQAWVVVLVESCMTILIASSAVSQIYSILSSLFPCYDSSLAFNSLIP